MRGLLAGIFRKVPAPLGVLAALSLCAPVLLRPPARARSLMWAFDVTTTFNPTKNAGTLEVHTSIGQSLEAQYVFLRSLPEAA